MHHSGQTGWAARRFQPLISIPTQTPIATAIPAAFADLGSLEFSRLLLERADVAVAPGIGFGEHGEGFVRIGLVENEHRIRQAARSVKKFLAAGPDSGHKVDAISRQPAG